LDLEDVPAPIEQMLRRQLTLIQQRDTGRHSMAELYQSY
jgi:Tfp pilus assembly pilus retraction ATPase PilT